jgi:hypothetical protein
VTKKPVPTSSSSAEGGEKPFSDTSKQDRLRRMTEERSFLINSGVYREDDHIINELDQRIQQFIEL